MSRTWILKLAGISLLASAACAFAQEPGTAPSADAATQAATSAGASVPASTVAIPADAASAQTPTTIPAPADAAVPAEPIQTPAPAPATTPADASTVPVTAQAATPAADSVPSTTTPTDATQTATPAAAPQDVSASPAQPDTPAKVVVSKRPPVVKKTYTCPTSSKEILVLDATPELDQEGKQVIDPDGKPLFNPAVRQQRDKRGYPVCTPDGKPVMQTKLEMGYDEKGKKIAVAKAKPPKERPIDISRGTFTVDGMIGKAEMNYHIPNMRYIYFYAPGIGVAVISDQPFPGAVIQKTAFSNKTLTVMVGEHILQLASDNVILGKSGHPEPAYVVLDREFKLPSKYPVVGFGTVREPPYQWPGSKPNTILKGLVDVPPTPRSLRAVMLLSACPAGEMRQPLPDGFVALPGAQIPDQPCVPIGGVIKGAGSTVADKGRSGSRSAAPATNVAPEHSAAPDTAPATPTDVPAATPPPQR